MTSPTPSSSQPTGPWGRIVLIVGAGVIAACQVGKAPPVLTMIRAEMGMGLFLAGWIISIFSVIGLAIGPFAGAAADRLGRKRLVLGGLFCLACGSLAGSFAPGPGLLLLTRVVEGFGFVILTASAPALVAALAGPDRMRLAMGMWACFLPLGAGLVMFTVPTLVGLAGWRGLWRVNSAALVVYALVMYRILPPDRTGRADGQAKSSLGATIGHIWSDVIETAKSGGPLLLGFTFTFYAMQWLIVMGFLPTMLVEDQGLSPDAASWLTAGMVFMNVPGNLAGGWLLQRGAARWRLIALAAGVMSLCGLGIFNGAVPFGLRYACCLALSFFGGLVPSSLFAGAPVHAPSPALVAATVGVVMQCAQLGQFIGPPLAAAVVSAADSWSAAAYVMVSGSAGVFALSLLIRRREARM